MSAIPSAVSDFARACGLAASAQALAQIDVDRDRAAELAAEAERVARSLASPGQTALVLVYVAVALARVDPRHATRLTDDAERAARSIGDDRMRADVLALAADALASTDRERAARLVGDAERVAQSIAYSTPKYALRAGQSFNEYRKAHDLSQVARTLSSSHPDRAERIARSIADEGERGEALGEIMAESLRDSYGVERGLYPRSRFAGQAFLTVFFSG